MNKLLFIDDEFEILDGYKKIFRKKDYSKINSLAGSFLDEKLDEDEETQDNYEVYTASQGKEGIEIIKEHLDTKFPIKVVFIDMRMPPGIDGSETAKQIRDLDPNVEIVIVTAYSDTNLSEIVKKVGTPDKLLYVKKPFDSQEILQLALNLTVKYRNERIKEDFMAGVSHELKTPLASIIGFYQLLEEEELNEDAKEYVNILGFSAHLMSGLIEELLMTQEFKNKGVILNKEQVEISVLLQNIAKSFQGIFKTQEAVNFEFDIDKGLEDILIDIDSRKVSQCINNILQNAMKFTEEGKVILSAKLINNEIVISIADTGIGIPSDKVSDIFDKFSRVEDKHHQIPGLGLGLNIVKNIMDAHQAKIDIESEPGKGTTFYLNFQLNQRLSA